MRITDETRGIYLTRFADTMSEAGIPLAYLDTDEGGAIRWCASLDAEHLTRMAWGSGDYWLWRWLVMASGKGVKVRAVLGTPQCSVIIADDKRPVSGRTIKHLARVVGDASREAEQAATARAICGHLYAVMGIYHTPEEQMSVRA